MTTVPLLWEKDGFFQQILLEPMGYLYGKYESWPYLIPYTK